MKYLIVYFVFINLLSMCVCVLDKRRAVKAKRRISEKTLFLLCFFGGCPLMYLTMLTIRHKTLHKRFMIGIPFIFLVQLSLLLLIAIKFPSLLTFVQY